MTPRKTSRRAPTGTSPPPEQKPSLISLSDESTNEIAGRVGLVIPKNDRQIEGFKDDSEGTGKKRGRKVVKKTVRLVKRMVKKKVPKRVLTGPGKEALDGGIVGNSNAMVVEISKGDDIEVENNEYNGTVAVDAELFVCGSSGFNVMEVGKNSFIDNPVEVEKSSSSVDNVVEVVNLKESESCEREHDGLVDEILCEAPVLVGVGDANHGGESERTVSVEEDPSEDENGGLVGDQNDECNSEKVSENICEAPVLDGVGNKNHGGESEKTVSMDKDWLEDVNRGLVGDKNDECKSENVNSIDGEGQEGVKEEVKNSREVGANKVEVGLGDVALLSGEMEALERRRRRKTEVFVGGLDKDAKEEDIRKVFEEVGEVIEVTLVMNGKTGKNKGYAFVRYASAPDAKKALEKYSQVEICGKQCGTSLVKGNDTIFLGNIDKKWKSEDVVKLLQEIGIDKIDKVTVVVDPTNLEFNRGFAFVELQTSKDAQIAYNKLQKKDAVVKHLKIKVEWAEPLIEPDDDEMLKVKSVYAEYLPSSWDEEKVTDYFKKFGEIENVALARNLPTSRRKDFAFINYTTREAALGCIEAFSREQLNDEGSKVNVKVSLAKPIPKGKQNKHITNPSSKEIPKGKWNAARPVIRPYEPREKGKSTSSSCEDTIVAKQSSTTAELVQLLREQASRGQTRSGLGVGSVDLDHPYPSPGRKRTFSALWDDPLYSNPRGFPRTRLESSYPLPSALPQGVAVTSLPRHHQQGAGYISESFYGVEDHPKYIQARERAPYQGSSGVYRRY